MMDFRIICHGNLVGATPCGCPVSDCPPSRDGTTQGQARGHGAGLARGPAPTPPPHNRRGITPKRQAQRPAPTHDAPWVSCRSDPEFMFHGNPVGATPCGCPVSDCPPSRDGTTQGRARGHGAGQARGPAPTHRTIVGYHTQRPAPTHDAVGIMQVGSRIHVPW
jgi:hypothetical protein